MLEGGASEIEIWKTFFVDLPVSVSPVSIKARLTTDYRVYEGSLVVRNVSVSTHKCQRERERKIRGVWILYNEATIGELELFRGVKVQIRDCSSKSNKDKKLKKNRFF